MLRPIDPDLARFAVLLEEHDIPCMAVGSVASTAWGEPRTTIDIDLVIAARPGDAERIAASYPQPRYYVPPLETIRHELGRGSQGTFNIIDGDTGLKADLYPGLADPLNVWGMERRQPLETEVGIMFVAPPTCVIAGKLRYFAMSRQDKHLRDIRGMLAISGRLIDRAVVDHWARVAGVEAEWRDCQARPGAE